MHKKLIATIAKTTQPNAVDIDLCRQFFKPISIQKNIVLEEQNKIPEYLYFINSGFMRLFYYDENGDEVTTNLSDEGSFICSFLSLINGIPAKENVECITDCELLKVSKTDLLNLINSNETFKSFSLVIFQEAIANTEIRANDLATLNAEQRYKKFIANQSPILQNVPVQYIASYLGMKPESLSRIRRQIIS
jgi:CRP/FNR family transcriptional regulator, anaerobic regulatory protein